jgi:hypothetical protein
MILEMNLRAQAEYLKQKEQEEEAERIRLQAEEKRKAEELEFALNEAKRLAEEEAKRRADIEQRMKFVKMFREDYLLFQRSQAITRAFVFSYFELLNFLGIKEKVITKKK